MPAHDVDFRSLCIATDVDVLPNSAQVEQRETYVAIRTPSNPTYHWGNYLVFPDPPMDGCREAWEAAFRREITERNDGSTHVAIAWDRIDGSEGAARSEFVEAGYDLDRVVGLTAAPGELRAHARASVEAQVRALDPDGDAEAWAAVEELGMGSREPSHPEEYHREFLRKRMADRIERFRAGDGAWYGAWIDGELAGSLGIVVTAGRARFQAVETAERFRRRGVARKLVYDAAMDAAARFEIDHFVIGALEDYHALQLYTSLGFEPRETVVCVTWWPTSPNAGQHPTFVAEA
jgi:GNAT superfamily N-acetyltransferase